MTLIKTQELKKITSTTVSPILHRKSCVTLTFDLWPWRLAVYRLWRDKMLNRIWTQSSNPRWSYCDFNMYDLERVRVAFGSGVIFIKFELRLDCSVFMPTCYVTISALWPTPKTRWPWKLVVHQVSSGQSMYEIWAKSSDPLLDYRQFCEFLHTLCHAVIWNFALSTLKFYNASAFVRLNSIQNLREIE